MMPPAKRPPAVHFSARLGAHQSRVDQALCELADQKVVARLWERDHTVWKAAPTDIHDRLGWLQCVSAMQGELERVNRFVRDVRHAGYRHVLVLGMGGSSLAADLFGNIFGAEDASPQLTVLDSTEPGAVLACTQMFDPTHTLFLVSSKSGTTVETLSLFKHFYNHAAATQQEQDVGRHFVAITDAETPLADLAARYGFRDTFLAPADIGGRYAALSHFGLIPAALVGVDLARLLQHAEAMMQACGAAVTVQDNPAARLGAILGALARAGHDKATISVSPSLGTYGAWVEQLLAESTGKEGKAIIPVVHEPLGLPESYGDDRLFIRLALADDHEEQSEEVLAGLAEAGYAVAHMRLHDPYELGGQVFLWELATAIAGHLLGINPFDQPNVEAAKQHTQRVVQTYHQSGALPHETPSATYDDMLLYGSIAADTPEEALLRFLQQGQPGDYVAIQAYLPPPLEERHTPHLTPELAKTMQETSESHAALLSMCARIRDRYGLAATFGYGPRYLHSTGQQHKGDAGGGLFIQFTADAEHDVPIPAEAGALSPSLTFGTLLAAQAYGDREALRAAGRRLMHFHLGTRLIERLHQLNRSLA